MKNPFVCIPLILPSITLPGMAQEAANPFVKKSAKNELGAPVGPAFASLTEHILVPPELLDDWLRNHPMKEDATELRAAVQQSSSDAVLLAKLVSVDKQKQYVPPRVDYVPSFGYGHGFYDYYGMSYQTVYRPGYTTVDTIVELETTVFATDTEQMVWAGATESFNPGSAQKVVTENADLIIASMEKAGLL